MIRIAIIAASAAVSLAAVSLPAVAAEPAKPAAQAPAAKPKYTSAETDIGTLLDDPAAKAIVEAASNPAACQTLTAAECTALAQDGGW